MIRQAPEDKGMMQSGQAEISYLKQSSISKIEAGTRSVAAEEILYLSYALDKPIIYFFPEEFSYELRENRLSVLEKELLMHVRRLENDDLRKLIVQARALAEFKK